MNPGVDLGFSRGGGEGGGGGGWGWICWAVSEAHFDIILPAIRKMFLA